MAKIQLLLCFTILFASVTLLDVVSAHLKLIKPNLPQIEPPQTLKDVEPYTVKVVMVFVSDLEKECPKTNKFKAFFDRLRGYAKYVCPIQKKGEVEYEKNLKAKAGSLFQAISSFAVGKIRKEIQEEKTEVIRTFKFMRFVAAKIMEGRKNGDIDETMKLTTEQQKEINEGIKRWETIIIKIANTMVMSTTNSSSTEVSTTGKGSSSENNKSSGSGSSGINNGASFDDTTGSSNSMGSPSGSPSSSPSGSSGTSLKDTTSGSPSSSPSGTSGTSLKDTTGGSPSISPSGTSGTSVKDTTGGSSTSQTGSTTSKNVETSQSKTVTVTQVETETSQAVSSFIMNLEQKCPQKEEYKVFFENLKATMIAPSKVASRERKGFFSRIKSAAGKLSDAMAFMRSRIGSKSAEVKKSMETYQEQMMKTMQELETIHSQIVSQNQGKKGGAVKCTPAQQAQIKQTITKWEEVTTQFVETAVKSETQTSTTSSLGKLQAN